MCQMQGRLRLKSRTAVLALASRCVDADLAVEHLAMWDMLQVVPDSLVVALVKLSRESGRPDVVEGLLETLQKTQQLVPQEAVTEFKQWAERWVVAP